MKLELTEDHLKTLEELGGAFMSIKECATILEVDFMQLKTTMSNAESPAFKSYYKGWFLSKHALYRGIVKSAERGSNPAQQLLKKILDDAEGKNALNQ